MVPIQTENVSGGAQNSAQEKKRTFWGRLFGHVYFDKASRFPGLAKEVVVSTPTPNTFDAGYLVLSETPHGIPWIVTFPNVAAAKPRVTNGYSELRRYGDDITKAAGSPRHS